MLSALFYFLYIICVFLCICYAGGYLLFGELISSDMAEDRRVLKFFHVLVLCLFLVSLTGLIVQVFDVSEYAIQACRYGFGGIVLIMVVVPFTARCSSQHQTGNVVTH